LARVGFGETSEEVEDGGRQLGSHLRINVVLWNLGVGRRGYYRGDKRRDERRGNDVVMHKAVENRALEGVVGAKKAINVADGV
jgi:hypothetical protein